MEVMMIISSIATSIASESCNVNVEPWYLSAQAMAQLTAASTLCVPLSAIAAIVEHFLGYSDVPWD